jgi:hypothetical protein
MQEIFELLQRLAHERFYGAVTLKFEAGRIGPQERREFKTYRPIGKTEEPT